MCLEKLSPFSRMVCYAIIGIVLGIIFGFLFSLLIAWVSQQFGTGFNEAGSAPPYGMAVFFGMGCGAAIGAILGGIYANKK